MLWLADISFQKEADKLMNGEVVNVEIRNDFSYENLRLCSDGALWSLLYYAGYITATTQKGICVYFTS